MKASIECITLIQHYEGCVLKAYKCTSGIWTIGWGHTGKEVKEGLIWTQAKADSTLSVDIVRFERDVSKLVTVSINQRQFDALVSFAFNVGSDIDADIIPEGLGDSTLLKLVNSNKMRQAADEFIKWNKSAGKSSLGLTRRRHAERSLFLGNVVEIALRTGDWVKSCA